MTEYLKEAAQGKKDVLHPHLERDEVCHGGEGMVAEACSLHLSRSGSRENVMGSVVL